MIAMPWSAEMKIFLDTGSFHFFLDLKLVLLQSSFSHFVLRRDKSLPQLMKVGFIRLVVPARRASTF